MNNICKNILLFSPFIKYVGVIDRYGKLITGLCKNDYMLMLINKSLYPFLFDKITPAIDYFSAIIAYDYHNIFKSKLYNYLLIEKSAQNLVIFPITDKGDKYICIFSESDGDIIEVIDKLLLVVF
ncbi:MAG: hypothetical protein ACXWFC_12415 [Nitrososphaeraceae archaeon]